MCDKAGTAELDLAVAIAWGHKRATTYCAGFIRMPQLSLAKQV